MDKITLAFATFFILSALCLDAAEDAVLLSEFICETPPTPACHASTIVETKEGFVASWFGGTAEGKSDVGIWVARRDDKGWSAPVQVATATDDGKPVPCWNPVLFQPKDGPLLLFYKASAKIENWRGLLLSSNDCGKTWSEPRALPAGFLGPIKNKPVQLADGTILCPSSTEHAGWRVHLERVDSELKNWTKTEPLHSEPDANFIQPTILQWPENKLQLLCRDRKSRGIFEIWSDDGGKSWRGPAQTTLPNPNSGIDAITLKDGRALLVYNHTPKGRSPLNVALSSDGKTWQAALVLENQPGEYSYPAVIQSSDGRLHITYTWKRQRVRHVVIDPAKLTLSEIKDGKWPGAL